MMARSMELQYEPEDIDAGHSFMAQTKQKLRERILMPSRPPSESAIWISWGKETLASFEVCLEEPQTQSNLKCLQSIPRPISLPLFRLSAPPDPASRPVDYREARRSFGPAAIPDSMKKLKSLLDSGSKEIGAKDILHSVGMLWKSGSNGAKGDVEDPLALRLLDEFGD